MVGVLVLVASLFFITGNNKALGEHDIAIISPKNGSTLTTTSVPITVEYSVDYGYSNAPSPSQRLSILFKGSSQTGGGAWIDTTQSVPSGSGSVSITASVPGTGYYTLTVILQAEGYGTVTYTACDFMVNYSGAVASVPASSSSDGSTGGAGVAAAVIIGGGAVVGGGLLLRRIGQKNKSKTVFQKAPIGKKPEPGTIEEAAANLAEGRRNKALLDRFTRIRDVVWSDDRLLDFVDNARGSIIGKNGQINEANLNRLESILKRWIERDKLAPQMPDYGGTEFYYDTVSQASHSLIIRGGMAYLTAGYSEMALNPAAALSTMRDSVNQGDSTAWAVFDGYWNSSTYLALGESGRLLKYAKPLVDRAKDAYNLSRLSQVNQELSQEISTVNQLASQADDAARYSRDAYIKSTEVVKAGEAAAPAMDHAEKLALELNNNPEFRKLLAENSKLVPAKVKEVMGIAKQKVYQQARDNAISDVMEQMGKEGVPTGENPFFINQTGTHAQPGNPGWNSLKSDFDHTVDFGSSKYNQLYEQRFNAHLESQGTSATAIDANVYGAGTSSRGAYSGGAMRFVEHYNSTSGSDIMVRAKDGVVTISRETPQTSTSLLSRMNAEDVKSASSNYQTFFQKDVAKGSSLESQIVNGSKTVSRNAGQYSAKYVENFQKTGSVKYQPPDAAKVADLIKKRGFSVNDAMKKVGYNGSKEQLLNDYKNIMGVK